MNKKPVQLQTTKPHVSFNAYGEIILWISTPGPNKDRPALLRLEPVDRINFALSLLENLSVNELRQHSGVATRLHNLLVAVSKQQ